MQHFSSSAWRSALGASVSVAAHVAAFLVIPQLPADPTAQIPVAIVEFEVAPPPEPPPQPPQTLDPKPEPAPDLAKAEPELAKPLPVAAPETNKPQTDPEETPKVPSLEPGPLDLGELADLGQGDSVAVGYSGNGTGSGSGRAPSQRAPAAPPTSRPAPVAAPSGPISIQDLRSAPRAPALDGMLARLYPSAARAAGIGGQARVRVLIAASGAASVLGVVSESYAGFGAACQQTVQGSRWSAPVDREGQRVSTTLIYRCHFRVDR